MFNDEPRQVRPSASITAAGVDHVRLSYHYLDSGDLDGYGSLLDEHMRVCCPGSPPGDGRAQVLRMRTAPSNPPGRHEVHKVVAEGHSVVVTGRFTPTASDPDGRAGPPAPVDFADFFTLTNEGLLLTQRRYYYLAPAWA